MFRSTMSLHFTTLYEYFDLKSQTNTSSSKFVSLNHNSVIQHTNWASRLSGEAICFVCNVDGQKEAASLLLYQRKPLPLIWKQN